MAELISSNHSKKLPEFVDYPVAKARLKECLRSAPVAQIRVSFFDWTSDKSYDAMPHLGRKRKASAIPDSILLSASYDERDQQWAVWVHPIRKTHLSSIRDEFESEGLARLAKLVCQTSS